MFDKVRSIFAHGVNIKHSLLKVAISCAENGYAVWFITPQEINSLPDDLPIPDTEVSKLLTFLYLKDYSDLLSILHGIHGWNKIPNIIIVNSLNVYVREDNNDFVSAAHIISNVISAGMVCAKKHKDNKAMVLMGCSNIDFYKKFIDLHCSEVFNADSNDLGLIVNG